MWRFRKPLEKRGVGRYVKLGKTQLLSVPTEEERLWQGEVAAALSAVDFRIRVLRQHTINHPGPLERVHVLSGYVNLEEILRKELSLLSREAVVNDSSEDSGGGKLVEVVTTGGQRHVSLSPVRAFRQGLRDKEMHVCNCR